MNIWSMAGERKRMKDIMKKGIWRTWCSTYSMPSTTSSSQVEEERSVKRPANLIEKRIPKVFDDS